MKTKKATVIHLDDHGSITTQDLQRQLSPFGLFVSKAPKNRKTKHQHDVFVISSAPINSDEVESVLRRDWQLGYNESGEYPNTGVAHEIED